MTRDYERRRLRDIYDRNRRRVDAVANARDRNERRGDRDRDSSRKSDKKGSAPRRYIVSERVTRRAGFGDGGRQGRVSGARRRDGSRRTEDRFADKKVTRRSHRDRFDRAENNAEKRNGGGRRRRGGDAVTETRRGSRRASNSGNGKKDSRDKQQGGRRFSRASERRDQRKSKPSGKTNTKPAKNIPLTGDDLNAQLEAYKNNEVFNPAVRQQQAAQAQRAANTLQSLDAQLDAYRN